MDQNHLNNFGRGPPKDHLREIISKLEKGFRRSCKLSQMLTDGRRTDEGWPQKLTLSLHDRWANKKNFFMNIHSDHQINAK